MPPEHDPPPVITESSLSILDTVGEVLTSWIPFLEGFGTWERLGVVAVIAAAVVMGVIALIRTVSSRKAARAAEQERDEQQKRDADTVAELKETVSGELITELSVREGVSRARTRILRNITDDFTRIGRVLPQLCDENLASKTEEHQVAVWTAQRRAEFCIRYATPLSVLLEQNRLDRLADEASLPVELEVIAVGERESGLYALIRTTAPTLPEEWREMTALMRSEMDAPKAVVYHADANTVILELMDRVRRYTDAPIVVDTPSADQEAAE